MTESESEVEVPDTTEEEEAAAAAGHPGHLNPTPTWRSPPADPASAASHRVSAGGGGLDARL